MTSVLPNSRAPMARPGRRAVRRSTGREEMAVRRQLQRFFEEPQVRGTIVVERPLSSEPPPAPPPTSEVPRCYELRPEDCAVFQCRGCWAVLGDSLHLCALEEQRLGLLVCLSQCCGPGRAGPGSAHCFFTLFSYLRRSHQQRAVRGGADGRPGGSPDGMVRIGTLTSRWSLTA